MDYINEELRIPFGDFERRIIPQPPAEGPYFDRYLEIVKFCREPVLPPHIQQVHSSDGWLCEMRVLPIARPGEILAEIESIQPQTGHATITPVNEESIGGFTILYWRYQSGKTRLDHFLLPARLHYYLLISSPYGDGENIRKLIESTEYV